MRNVGLDLLRLVAVMLVLGRHLLPYETSNPVVSAWRTGGWIGVDLFFVLSGFLVSGLLFQEHKRQEEVDLKRFAVRRFFKIYPPLLVLIAVTVMVQLVGDGDLRLRQTLSELCLLQNYAGSLWNHTWSIAVEFHFYAFLILIVAFALKRRKWLDDPFVFVPALCVAVFVVCLLLRGVFAFVLEWTDHKWLTFGTHARGDALMIGVFLGYLWHFRNLREWAERIPVWGFMLVGAILVWPAFVFEKEDHTIMKVFGYSVLCVGSAFIVLGFVRLESSRAAVVSALAVLGGASYSIYLWHMPVNWWLWPALCQWTGVSHETHWHLYITFYVVCSLLLGLVISNSLEKPSLALRDKLFPPRAKVGLRSESPNTGRNTGSRSSEAAAEARK